MNTLERNNDAHRIYQAYLELVTLMQIFGASQLELALAAIRASDDDLDPHIDAIRNSVVKALEIELEVIHGTETSA